MVQRPPATGEACAALLSRVKRSYTYHFAQVVNVYRSKLRGDIAGMDGDEIARQRIETYANKIRPAGFLVRVLRQVYAHF